MTYEGRLIYAKFAQHIADVELSRDEAGIVQWVLSHTPTVDAAEVVHGRWLSEMHSNSNNGTCSVCGSYEHAYAFEWKYCPFCGAKMDLKEGEQR